MGARRLIGAFVAVLCAFGGSLTFADGAALASSAAPRIEREWATAVGVSGATLHATIVPDPETSPETGSDTVYRFEYGTDVSYGSRTPVPDAVIAASTTGMEVTQPLGGLRAETTYHYRVVAVNPSGKAVGPDRVFVTFPPAASGDSCSNALIRGAQFSSYLPDCRAFEMVSPPDTLKAGADIAAHPTETQSSTDGNAIKYISRSGGFGDVVGAKTLGGADYVAERGPEGWASHSINPEQGSVFRNLNSLTSYRGLSPDLSKGVFFATTPVVPEHPNVEHVFNLYLRNDILSSGLGNYELLSDSAMPAVATLREAESPVVPEIAFAAASADWTHILFESNYDLTPQTAGLNPKFPKAYEWDNGTVRLVGILPDGTPAEASVAARGVGSESHLFENGELEYRGAGASWAIHAISADGSRAIFTGPRLTYFRDDQTNALPVAGNLYMRIDHQTTIQLNVSERAEGVDPNGPQSAMFAAATPDASKVFLITTQALTDNAPVDHGSHKLYMYDLNAPEGHHLTLISVDSEPAGDATEPANRAEAVVGMDDAANYVYFVGSNELLPGLPPLAHEVNETDKRRLYVWHNGVVHYVVSHQEEAADTFYGLSWGETLTGRGDTFRTSTDGKTIAFMSADPTTASRAGYDNSNATGRCNRGPREPWRCYEVYVYNVDRDELQCASCSATGAPAQGDASFIDYADTIRFTTQYLNHPLSSDGRIVFFDTVEALVPQDTNGQIDVYEYNITSKKAYLISSGTCGCGSYFTDADPDGGNAFFTTRQRLVYADADTSADLYDARIEGGIPAQNRPPAVPCAGEECQGPVPSPPVFSLPSSSTFAGAGNPPVNHGKPATKAVKHKAKRKAPHRKRHRHKAGKSRQSNGHASHRSGR